ncbi:MAG: hypothetical protein AAGA77_26125 [Bacteroidota bacterium]
MWKLLGSSGIFESICRKAGGHCQKPKGQFYIKIREEVYSQHKMMTLTYFNRTAEIAEIENRLKQLTLAYNLEERDGQEEPMFVDGKSKYVGIDEMNAYLDQLEREKEQWYYCGC